MTFSFINILIWYGYACSLVDISLSLYYISDDTSRHGTDDALCILCRVKWCSHEFHQLIFNSFPQFIICEWLYITIVYCKYHYAPRPYTDNGGRDESEYISDFKCSSRMCSRWCLLHSEQWNRCLIFHECYIPFQELVL